MNRTAVRWIAVAVSLVLSSGCSEIFSPGIEQVAPDGLTVIRVDPEAPPLVDTEVSFWAVAGEVREVQILYGYANGTVGKCLRFIVPAGALHRLPGGRIAQPGDSVQIAIRVVDPKLFLFEFDPAGLIFAPGHPARLEVRYRWATADLNGDGAVDQADAAIRSRFGLWKQERAGEPWQKVGSRRDEAVQELYADIRGFTRYALASD